MIYDEITEKCLKRPFSTLKKFVESGEIMKRGRDKFIELQLVEQLKALLQLIAVLKTGRIAPCNFEYVGGVKSFVTGRLPALLSNTGYIDIRIIDQSPTGLYEKKSDNLLKL